MATQTTTGTQPLGSVKSWSLTLTYPRRAYCPCCGYALSPQAAAVVAGILWCWPCADTPRNLMRVIVYELRNPKLAAFMSRSANVRAFTPRPGDPLTIEGCMRRVGLLKPNEHLSLRKLPPLPMPSTDTLAPETSQVPDRISQE